MTNTAALWDNEILFRSSTLVKKNSTLGSLHTRKIALLLFLTH
uniref:Uncharacterized protein n=1 Tax=Anguilla anguilla TaxID=7936 RepID=A0A0E9W966_ANGAN